MLNHANCPHPATKADRAHCRKTRSESVARHNADIDLLLQVFAIDDDRPTKWVFYAARRFADYKGESAREAAHEVLTYFRPSGDAARDEYRRRNGYTITDDFATMLHITLRAAS